ncbi:NADH dehydrogenase [Tribonema minus]|uniref:NADH dehydrogenase [ubiquinone] iron-sulfur protein 4, mitochondrial n=1 Tax=Tribonema minus TaxID=303371 RepID=A0A835YZQ1_9STRA|nr:NADH dehydrogenase [Tribonema minus]
MLAATRCGLRGAQRSRAGAVRVLSSNAPATPPPKPDPEVVEKMAEKARKARRLKVVPEHVAALPDLPGRTPQNKEEVAVLAMQPENHRKRVVTISQNAKSSMTSFRHNVVKWHIRWDDHKELETNALMGWAATSDPLASLDMLFEDKEKAIAFCEKMGWGYTLEESNEYTYDNLYGKKSYSYNFLPEAVLADLKLNKTKTKQFVRPGANASHYFRPLNFHGTAPVEQHGPKPEK